MESGHFGGNVTSSLGEGALLRGLAKCPGLWLGRDPLKWNAKGEKLNVAKGFKTPSFSDRANASAAAKRALLDKHKAAPKPDQAELAAANERRLTREAEVAAAREHARAAKEAAARAAEESVAAEAKAAAEAAKAAQPKMPTQAELKAARDARYAARKARAR